MVRPVCRRCWDHLDSVEEMKQPEGMSQFCEACLRDDLSGCVEVAQNMERLAQGVALGGLAVTDPELSKGARGSDQELEAQTPCECAAASGESECDVADVTAGLIDEWI